MSIKNQTDPAWVSEAAEKAFVKIPSTPKMNAVKHGLRSDAILLPGDDAAAFRAAREDLVRIYQPLSPAEMRCVERIAGLEWRIARHARWEAVFDDKLEAVLDDPDGTACQHNDPDPHRWQHRGDDCSKREARLDRMLIRAEQRLFLLQKMRRNRLIAGADAGAAATRSSGAVHLPALSSGAGVPPPGPTEPMGSTRGETEPGERPTTAAQKIPTTGQSQSEIPICDERNSKAGSLPPPGSWVTAEHGGGPAFRGHGVDGFGARYVLRSSGA